MLNVFEVVDESGTPSRILCLIDALRAGIEGIDPRTIIGSIPLDASIDPDEFEPETLSLNPGFVQSITQFLNHYALNEGADELGIQARSISSGWLYLIDPRYTDEADPGPENILGAYPIDESGQIVPNSFVYNEKHRLFDNDLGVSALLRNRMFFDWLNPPAE
jgi:hypothetical protein